MKFATLCLMALTAWSEERDEEVGERVRGILRDVARRGDAAVVEYTNRFDRRDAASMADLTVERAQLEAALERLPAEQRQAFEPCEIGGLDYIRIARMQGVPVGTVRSRLNRARHALRKRLQVAVPISHRVGAA